MPVEPDEFNQDFYREAGERRSEGEAPEPVEILYTELSPDALQGVIEAFVLREGTDYGDRIFTLDQKVAHVRAQLDRREVHILFDPATESVTLTPVADYNRARIPRK